VLGVVIHLIFFQMAKHPEIILNGLQIKSLEKAFKLSDALSVIEEECGIKEVKITLKNMFICSWIDLDQLNRTEMDLLLKDILTQIKNKKMNQNEIRSTWAKVANRVEDVTKQSKSDFVNKNKPAFEKDKFDLEFEYAVLEAIRVDTDFKRKFEHCLKAFL